MLKVSHLTKEYGSFVAVNDISFETQPGKIYGFLGPNGAGKSTTMNMITGYIAPTKGEILIDDVSMLDNPLKAKALIGYLPEIPPLYMDMTVLEYLNFAAGLKGIKDKILKEAEVSRVMELTNVTDVSDQVISILSKGYKQRVGLAQALLGDPKLIILDEPSVGLDPKQITEIRKLIKDLSKNHTVILSTHILSEAASVCDEVIIINKGQMLSMDTTENLINQYNEKQVIKLVLKGNSSKAESVLNGIEDIETMTVVSEDTDSCAFDITAKAGADIRETIFTNCSKESLTILELNVYKITLEDIYLKLTKEES